MNIMKRYILICISRIIVQCCTFFLMILLSVYVISRKMMLCSLNLLRLMIMFKVNFLSSMCVRGRFVTNKYTGVTFWSKCGKCESCLQEKAAYRSSRIRNEYDGVTPIFFIELDYDRFSCPYFTQDDFENLFVSGSSSGYVFKLPIYRYHNVRWDVNKQRYVHSFKARKLYDHIIEDNNFLYDPCMCRCRWLNKQPRKIGVPYFKDIQDFEKRFRQYLKRNLCYNEKIKYFNVNELGERAQRPHFHILLFAPGLTESEVREVVSKTWPFSDRARHEIFRVSRGEEPKVVQRVKDDPAGYVSSYVNSSSTVSPFLARYFKVAKHSASKFFGHGRRAFSLASIQEKINQGDLSYNLERIVNGVSTVNNLPIPKYVVNRYFPLFKGYSRFTDPQIREFISNAFDIGYLLRESLKYDSRQKYFKINYTCDKYANISNNPACPKFGYIRGDLHKLRTRLLHAFEFYRSVFPHASFDTYASSYVSAWNTYKSCAYKRFVTDDSISDFYKYDNIALFPLDRQFELHKCLDPYCRFIVDNNEKPHNINITNKMTQMYYLYDKQRKVSDSVRFYNS